LSANFGAEVNGYYDLIAVCSNLYFLAEDLFHHTTVPFFQIQPTTPQTFQLACENADVDIITIDCSQKMQFHPTRKLVGMSVYVCSLFCMIYCT
jgi:hypothetical protein